MSVAAATTTTPTPNVPTTIASGELRPEPTAMPLRIEVVERNEAMRRCILHITGLPTTSVNAIRREILSSVPSVGLLAEPPEKSTIHIQSNTGRLNNQFLGLRLSLVPVHLPPPAPGHPNTGVERYEVRLDVTADEPGVRNVTTDDLEIVDKETGKPLSPDLVRRIFPRDPNPACNEPILLVPLRGPNGERPGEAVKLRAGLVVGSGSVHACFSPVCNATYKMKIDETLAERALESAIDERKIRGTPREAGFRESFRLTEAQRFVERTPDGTPTMFQFIIESVTSRDPVNIFFEGAIMLAKRYNDIRTDMANLVRNKKMLLEKGTASGVRTELVMDGDEYLFCFRNEDHTLGTTLQDQLIRDIQDKDPERVADWFVGYRIPHPLTPEMVLRVHRSDLTLDEVLEGFVIPALETLEESALKVADTIRPEVTEHPLQSLVSGGSSAMEPEEEQWQGQGQRQGEQEQKSAE